MQQSPFWHSVMQTGPIAYPQSVAEWLLEEDSLTEKLKACSEGDFAVRVLSQRFGFPRKDERHRLGLSFRQAALIREVLLICQGKPWVYARTIVPVDSLQGRLRFLRTLGNVSLGAKLFKHPQLARSHFEIAKFLPDQVDSGLEALMEGKPAYGRRSLFTLFDKKILVAEVFLPPCLSHNPSS